MAAVNSGRFAAIVPVLALRELGAAADRAPLVVELPGGNMPSLVDFADKPLAVLTAGSGNDAAWPAAQNHLATLSTNSVHRVIAGATHEALIGDEGPAAATTQAILDVVASVRHPGPLGP